MIINHEKPKKPKFPEIEAELGRRGLKYKDLANLLNLSESVTGSRMAGISEFKLREVKIIVKFLNRKFDELFLN